MSTPVRNNVSRTVPVRNRRQRRNRKQIMRATILRKGISLPIMDRRKRSMISKPSNSNNSNTISKRNSSTSSSNNMLSKRSSTSSSNNNMLSRRNSNMSNNNSMSNRRNNSTHNRSTRSKAMTSRSTKNKRTASSIKSNGSPDLPGVRVSL